MQAPALILPHGLSFTRSVQASFVKPAAAAEAWACLQTTRVVSKDSLKHPGEKQVMGFVEFTNAVQASAAMHTLQVWPVRPQAPNSHTQIKGAA